MHIVITVTVSDKANTLPFGTDRTELNVKDIPDIRHAKWYTLFCAIFTVAMSRFNLQLAAEAAGLTDPTLEAAHAKFR